MTVRRRLVLLIAVVMAVLVVGTVVQLDRSVESTEVGSAAPGGVAADLSQAVPTTAPITVPTTAPVPMPGLPGAAATVPSPGGGIVTGPAVGPVVGGSSIDGVLVPGGSGSLVVDDEFDVPADPVPTVPVPALPAELLEAHEAAASAFPADRAPVVEYVDDGDDDLVLPARVGVADLDVNPPAVSESSVQTPLSRDLLVGDLTRPVD